MRSMQLHVHYKLHNIPGTVKPFVYSWIPTIYQKTVSHCQTPLEKMFVRKNWSWPLSKIKVEFQFLYSAVDTDNQTRNTHILYLQYFRNTKTRPDVFTVQLVGIIIWFYP